MTRENLFRLDRAARDVGRLQGHLRLLVDTMPAEVRDDVTAAADQLDAVDERLTKIYIEHAPGNDDAPCSLCGGSPRDPRHRGGFHDSEVSNQHEYERRAA